MLRHAARFEVKTFGSGNVNCIFLQTSKLSQRKAKASMGVLPTFDGAKILVIGDVMLDRYWFGDVRRISPEAPVPVLRVTRVEERPGGAANVANNIAALGAQATLLSVVGADEAGDALERLLDQPGNLAAQLHRDDTISTTIKLRAVARHQQLLRVDFRNRAQSRSAARRPGRFPHAVAAGRCGDPVRLRQGRAGAHWRDDPAGARGRKAGAGRSQGGRLPALSRRHPADAESGRVPRSGGKLERRSGLRREGAKRCAPNSGSMPCWSRAAKRA